MSIMEPMNVRCGRRGKVRAVARPDPKSCWLLVTVSRPMPMNPFRLYFGSAELKKGARKGSQEGILQPTVLAAGPASMGSGLGVHPLARRHTLERLLFLPSVEPDSFIRLLVTRDLRQPVLFRRGSSIGAQVVGCLAISSAVCCSSFLYAVKD